MEKMTEPAFFTAGNTVTWTKQYTDYSPDDGYILSYSMVKEGQIIEFTATDNGDGSFLVTLPAVDTAGYIPGEYAWQAYLTLGADRYPGGAGQMGIIADFSAKKDGYDPRSDVKKTLDAIQATLEGRASKDQASYTINGRTLERTSIPDLITLYDKYRNLYSQEENQKRLEKGLGTHQTIKVVF